MAKVTYREQSPDNQWITMYEEAWDDTKTVAHIHINLQEKKITLSVP